MQPGSTRVGAKPGVKPNQLLTNLENQGHERLVLWTLPQGPPSCLLLIEENRLLSPQASVLSKLLQDSLWPLHKGCSATDVCAEEGQRQRVQGALPLRTFLGP